MDASGALKRLLSATATLTNRSDAGVTVTLTDVVDSDPTPLLDKLDIVLIPDPDPTGNPVTLTAGTGKTDVLAILDAPADGVPTTSLLKVGGAAKADAASIGGDGDSFTIGLTLKAVKIIPST